MIGENIKHPVKLIALIMCMHLGTMQLTSLLPLFLSLFIISGPL